MSAAKPVIVAGNEGYHGLFGPDKLTEAQAGNFCCRGLPVSRPETLLADVSAAFSLTREERERLGPMAARSSLTTIPSAAWPATV